MSPLTNLVRSVGRAFGGEGGADCDGVGGFRYDSFGTYTFGTCFFDTASFGTLNVNIGTVTFGTYKI